MTAVAQLHTLPEPAQALLGRLIDAEPFPDFETAVGMVFVQGAGLRVGMISGPDIKQMSPARARWFAEELDAASPDLAEVTAALRNAADRLELLLSETKGSA